MHLTVQESQEACVLGAERSRGTGLGHESMAREEQVRRASRAMREVRADLMQRRNTSGRAGHDLMISGLPFERLILGAMWKRAVDDQE